MKPFGLLRLAVASCGLCALLSFPSACKAQSEISPDHFDGTDPWEAVAQKPHTAKPKPAQLRTVSQSNPKKSGTTGTVQLAATREFSTPARHDAVAVEDKRKPAVQKPNKK